MYSNNASDSVFDYIVESLKEGRYEPDTKIDTEEKLCETLNVSRIAVRQAIEKLVALQVLRKVQGSGTYVCNFEESSLQGMVYYKPTYERLLPVLVFRQQFDSGNVKLFIDNATDAEKEKLKNNYELMCNSVHDKEKFENFEHEFHDLISLGTHNIIIIHVAEMLRDLMMNYADLQYENVGPENCIKWHGRVIEALDHNDSEMARLCVVADIGNSIDSVKKILERER